MRAQGQRYTVYGGIEVEAAILALTKEVARLVEEEERKRRSDFFF